MRLFVAAKLVLRDRDVEHARVLIRRLESVPLGLVIELDAPVQPPPGNPGRGCGFQLEVLRGGRVAESSDVPEANEDISLSALPVPGGQQHSLHDHAAA